MKLSRTAMLLALLAVVPACSKEALRRGSYETLHNVSDQQNEIDPRYEPDRQSYDTYRQRREEILRPELAPVMPDLPATPPAELVGRLGVMPVVPDLGLDAVATVGRPAATDSAVPEVWFSIPEGVFSETLGPLGARDDGHD